MLPKEKPSELPLRLPWLPSLAPSFPRATPAGFEISPAKPTAAEPPPWHGLGVGAAGRGASGPLSRPHLPWHPTRHQCLLGAHCRPVLPSPMVGAKKGWLAAPILVCLPTAQGRGMGGAPQ